MLTRMEFENEKNISTAQKSIMHCIRMLAPFQKSDAGIGSKFLKEDIYAAEEEVYRFIRELYTDMYHSPGKYFIPAAPYDEYIKSAKQKAGIEKMHYTDSRECNLRNTFQQAIWFYPGFFYQIGLHAQEIREKDYALVIAGKDLEEVKASMEWKHIYKENSCRYEVMRLLGLETEQAGESFYITNKNYPRMFLGLWLLCHVPDSKYKYMNYLRLDFQGLYRAMPGIEDIMMTLTEEHAGIIAAIQSAIDCVKLKLRIKPLRNITSGSRWKAEYLLKNKNVFGFYAEPGYLMLCVYFNDVKNINEMSRRLEETDYGLFQWFSGKFPERLCKCPSNRWASFGGSRRRICGLSCRAEIENPNQPDVDNCIRILKLFRNI